MGACSVKENGGIVKRFVRSLSLQSGQVLCSPRVMGVLSQPLNSAVALILWICAGDFEVLAHNKWRWSSSPLEKAIICTPVERGGIRNDRSRGNRYNLAYDYKLTATEVVSGARVWSKPGAHTSRDRAWTGSISIEGGIAEAIVI